VLNGYDIINEVAAEAQAEAEEIMKSSHKAMKKWYKSEASLAEEFGRYIYVPSFYLHV
jgi:hypothetical protein